VFLAGVLADMSALAADDTVAHNPHVIDALARMRELVIMVRLLEGVRARGIGLTRRTRRHQAGAGTKSGAERREKARAFLEQIAAVAARPPARLTDVDTAKRYLQETDSDWSASSDAQRKTKVEAVTRHIRKARTITGT
jgi:hypothetical protein